jgi:tetraacyldisaccharide 4'-kinase
LRDLPKRAQQASIIVITGTPENVDPEKFLQNAPSGLKEKIIFSSYALHEPVLVHGQGSYRKEGKTLAVSGIARNHVFGEQEQPTLHLRFRDHHRYTSRDLEEMQRIVSENQLEQIITTEKDAVRLVKFRHELRDMPMYVLQISIHFLFEGEKVFQALISNFISNFTAASNRQT